MTIVNMPLNRYMIEMANPERGCIFGYYEELMHKDLRFKNCETCPFLASDKNNCIYEVISVETASSSESEYVQFVCIECGNIIQKRGKSYFSIYDDKYLKCKHCNRIYSYIDSERHEDIARFATRVVNNQQEFVEE